MGVSRGGARWAVLSAPLLVLLGGAVMAQMPEPSPRLQPIQAGPVELVPLFVTDLQHTDNLFFNALNPISATVFSATPGISARLPMRRSFAELAYALRYRSYGGDNVPPSDFSHFFRARGDFGFASGMVVSFAEEFQNGVLDTQNFDPGGEVRFRGDRFQSNTFAVSVAHQHLTRVIGVTVGSTRVDFDRKPFDPDAPDPTSTSFFDTDAGYLRLFGETRRTPRTWILAELFVGTSDLSRTIVGLPDDRERDSTQVRTGIRWVASPGSQLEAIVGYALEEFASPGRSSTYRGVVGSVNYGSTVPARPRLVVSVLRDVYPSVYLENDYYVSSRISVRLESPGRARLRIGCRVAFLRNDYPQSSPERVDNTWDARVWLGYRVGHRLEWGVFARKTARDSELPGENPITGEPIPLVEYATTSYGVVLQLGG